MFGLFARIWRWLRGPSQWDALWAFHAKFMIGVTGLVRDRGGWVLFLRHRMWPSGRQWGLPTGCARKRECFEDTVVREVKEETGLDVTVGQLVNMKSGYELRLEIAYAAKLVGGVLKLDSVEILEAQWFTLDELPPGALDAHRIMIEKMLPGIPPERIDRGRRKLTTLRASPDLNHHHSELSFATLSDVLCHSASLDPLRAQTLCGVNTVSIRCCPMTVTLERDDGQAGHSGVVAVLGD